MFIKRIKAHNFRLLKDFSIDLEENMSLLIGKNNTGKTSLLQLMSKMLKDDTVKIQYNDLNIDYRKNLIDTIVADDTIEVDRFVTDGVKLRLYIQYNDNDDLSNLGQILMDLDEEIYTAVLAYDFELTFDKYIELRNDYQKIDRLDEDDNKNEIVENLLKKKLLKYFKLTKKSFAFDKEKNDIDSSNYIDISKRLTFHENQLIAFEYINAQRQVDNKERDTTLSEQSFELFDSMIDDESNKALDDFQHSLIDADKVFTENYRKLFEDIVENVSSMGGYSPAETKIRIVSTLQQRNLLKGNTAVMYEHDDSELPENYNGLGYMNLISMIFQIEIIRRKFLKGKNERVADIDFLVIEEPEAHTHPQMQYVFIKNIKTLLNLGLMHNGDKRQIQSLISTHSSHIVAECDFDDIKYMLRNGNSVISKNMKDLESEYNSEQDCYTFLKHYLTLNRSELFFADKAIFIEGDTERILLPTIMKKLDQEESLGNGELSLLQQNISIIEVGAYSHIFGKFINFIGLKKALVFTDLDCGKFEGNGRIKKCEYDRSANLITSNNSLRNYFDTNNVEDLLRKSPEEKTFSWNSKLRNWQESDEGNFKVYFQVNEGNYQARSFEDGFFHINKQFLKEHKDEFLGLNKNKLAEFIDDTHKITEYDLAENGINSKATLAVEIVYFSKQEGGKEFVGWIVPKYIKDGLLWIRK